MPVFFRGFLVEIAERVRPLARLAVEGEGADEIAAGEFHARFIEVGIGDEVFLIDAVDLDAAAVIGFESVVLCVGPVDRQRIEKIVAQRHFVTRLELIVLEPHEAERRIEDRAAGIDG